MAKIGKAAGAFSAEAWTDGWPIWVKIKWGAPPHAGEFYGLQLDDLKDLQYVLNDMIEKLGHEDHRQNPRRTLSC